MIRNMVSIVIPVYNGADYLRCAIDSALAQTYANCEVIVVNDGSNDDGKTEDIARSYGDRIRYIRKENGGVATALNMGIENMRGEYFSWLSHDDYYLPGKVQSQMDQLQALPPDTILYSGYTVLDTDTKMQFTMRFSDQYTEKQLSTPLFAVFNMLLCGCAMLIHKSHFDRVGLFNPARKTTQDYEMWFRMFRDAQIHYCDACCDVVLRQHPNQGSKTIGSNLAECNELWIWLDRQLKDYERAQIDGTPELFYRRMYERIQSVYEEAAQYYRGKAENEALRWERADLSDEERFTSTLIHNYCSELAQRKDMREQYDKTSLSKRLGKSLYFHGFIGTAETLIRKAYRRLLLLKAKALARCAVRQSISNTGRNKK